jgi:hypothetical protein
VPIDRPSTARREALVFWGGCALLWGFLATIAALTPIILDDWYQVAYIEHHGLTPASIWANAVYNYFQYNPRLGENLLLIVNGPPIINVLVTPTVELIFLFAAFAVGFGRWPRPTRRDGQLMVIMLALIWLAAPVPGILFAYRPFCTNYLYALAWSLLFVLPYRMAVEPGLRPRWWLAPVVFVAGWVAGMGNEHTGPTAAVAVLGLVYLYWRKHRRIHAWMVTGFVGLAIGYPMLFFAPGQKQRYGSLAARQGPIDYILERGPDGLFEIVIDFLWEAQLAVLVILTGVFVAMLDGHRRGRPAPSPDRRQVLTMLALITCAFAIVGTLFASPTTGERLFFAPATLFVLAGMVLVDVLAREQRPRRAMLGIALVAIAAHVTWGLYTYTGQYAEGVDREHRLATATPGTHVQVPPLTRVTRNLWFLGEDLDYASLREFVAHQVYGLAGIEMDRPVRAEPSVPFHTRLTFTMDPPMTDAEVWQRLVMPLSYVSAYPDRVIQLIRRLVPQLKRIPGHHVKEVVGYVDGWSLPEFRGRPLLGVRWKDGDGMVIDYIIRADRDLRLYFLLRKGTYPEDLTDAYISSCGKTISPVLQRESRGIRLAYVPWCRGLVITTACTAAECWLVGTYWH